MVLLTGIVLLPLAFAAIACGNETTKIENVGGEVTRGISVSGEGKVTAAPDVAVITMARRCSSRPWRRPATRRRNRSMR
jgi:uncharacterized protein YggE